MVTFWKFFSGTKWQHASKPDAQGVVGRRHDGVMVVQTRGGKFRSPVHPAREWDDFHRAIDMIDTCRPPDERVYFCAECMRHFERAAGDIVSFQLTKHGIDALCCDGCVGKRRRR